MTSNYYVSFVSFAELLNSENRNNFFRFVSWIDEQHGDNFATKNVFQTIKALQNPFTRQMAKNLCELTWYVVLKQNNKVVCVAMFQRCAEITTITTAKDERKKGHATYLMKYLANFFQSHNVMVICPTEKRILPILAKAGWTIADGKDNKDGTTDTMPEYVKEEYLRTTSCKPLRPLNERTMAEVMEFMEYLPKFNVPVPVL